MSPLLFWELSIGEVVDVIDAKSKAEKERLKFEVMMNQVQSIQIKEHISVLFDKDNLERLTPIWAFYPELFNDEKNLYEQQIKDKDLEEFKNRRLVFANNHNKAIGGDDN